MARNPPWVEEELVLALDLYLRFGVMVPADPEVVDVSRFLRTLTIHGDRPVGDDFRNPNGVALKTANFASIDPAYEGSGMSSTGKRAVEAWERYASDRDALAAAVAAVREGNELPTAPLTKQGSPQVIRTAVESQHVEKFLVSITAQTIEAERREASLVQAYRDHLESQGHMLRGGRYRLPSHIPMLACDLVDDTDKVRSKGRHPALIRENGDWATARLSPL